MMEMPAIADVFRFFAGAARCLPGMAAESISKGMPPMIRRDPVGVVASIAPWNYPLMMAAAELPAPALAAGNCVVMRPRDHPLTALKLAELAKDIFPEVTSTCCLAAVKSGGRPLDRHVKSARNGLLTDRLPPGPISSAANTASSIKRTHMGWAVGASDRFDDADIDAVVDGVRTFGFYNAGEDCTTACRIYANRRVSMTSWWRSSGRRWPAPENGAPRDAATELGR